MFNLTIEELRNQYYDAVDKLQDKEDIKNAEGKRMLEKTLLNYSIEIIEELKTNPKLLNNLLDELAIAYNKHRDEIEEFAFKKLV